MDQRPVADYQDEFARIEGEVDGGNADLSGLGFWGLVRRVNLESRLAEHWADVVGRIDRKAFRANVRLRVPVWLGNAVLLLGTAVLIGSLVMALRLARGPGQTEATAAGILTVVAAGGLSVTVHCPAHWLVGRVVGIRFVAYFIGGPLKVTPGIKSDYATYLRTPPDVRATMHAAGAVASKIAPFAVFAAVYLPHRAAGYALLPAWSLWAVLGIGVAQVVTDVLWSRTASDWKKVRRERRLAAAQRAAAV